ncbi:hypothetical protein BGZ95_003856 [Linnemannia exigua]|uniref:Galactose oxidase n=1 Tax=Linnemannia exigua TaxID=604196 RepID=A0AAD4H144_9FUNG|nr:hypothetical protein BGZ95_003856 [Linnemannia exigua]
MIPLLCSQCNGCRFRTTAHRTTGPQRSKRKRILSTPHHKNQRRRLLAVTTTSLILLSLSPPPIHAQQQPQPFTFKSRYSSGSAIAHNRLYIVSGYTSDIFPSDAVGDTIFVPLDQPFTTDAIPWTTVQSPWNPPKRYSMNGTDAVVVPTADQSHLILLGASGLGDPLLMSYDILADSWAPYRSDPAPPRSAVGAALDLQTGTIIVQGGFIRNFAIPLSSEIDILSTNGSVSQWTWTKGLPTITIKPIFQPIVVYLPTRKATLIIGGTEYANNTIAGFQQFNQGYLVTTTTTTNGTTLSTSIVNLTATDITVVPPRRLSPCYTVLENGDLFMYGGATFASSLNDAWILGATDLMWKNVFLGGAPHTATGRAGATCQLISPGYIMVVGGKSNEIFSPSTSCPIRLLRFDAAIGNTNRPFAEPQIGIIDTKRWVWTPSYTPPRTGLPLGAIIGIILGSCMLLGIGLFFAGRILWKRRKSTDDKKISRDSVSTHPLMGSDSTLSHQEGDRFLSTRNLVSPTPSTAASSTVVASNMGSEFQSIALSPKDERSLPLLISPYKPSSSYNSSAFSFAGGDSPERGSTPTRSGYKTKGAKSEVSLPESERLPQTMADMQRGYYIKTLQHNKQYEKRRHDINRQHPQNGLNRNITSNHYAILNDEYHDGLDLATAVLQLKDVEMGEESIMIPLQTLETGTILVSSHLDDQGLLLQSPTTTTTMTQQGSSPPPMPKRPIQVPRKTSTSRSSSTAPGAKTELNDEEEEEVYQPGIGGSITMLKEIKAAKAKAKAEEAQKQQQRQLESGRRMISPLSEEELVSQESEVLVDNRRGKRS